MKELIQLAKEKGFKGRVFCQSEIESDLIFYLWSCEVQKWLRDIHSINITLKWVYSVVSTEKAVWGYEVKGILMVNNNILDYTEDKLETYEQALEEGLKQALELLK